MFQVFKKSFEEFCANTSLHGYKYVVYKKATKFERIIWLLVVVSLHLAALIVSWIAYDSYSEFATITVTDSTHYPIWNYPFPAVTSCSINKISKRKAYALARSLEKPPDLTSNDLAIQFRLLLQMLNQNDDRNIQGNLTRLQAVLDANRLEPHRALQKLSYGCKGLQRCLWKSEEKRCEDLVEELPTIDGYCCTFNYFGVKNRTIEGLYAKKTTPTTPRRVAACGFASALEFLVQNDEDDLFALDVPSNGHKIYIHHPYQMPDLSVPFIMLPKQFILFISITPTITYSTKRVRLLPVNARKCLHYDEKELISFQYYTHHNCLTECKMNLTRSYCSCVPFYYVNANVPFFNNLRICNLKDVPCLKRIKEFTINVSLPSNASEKRSGDDLCKCLPTCEFTLYPYEGSSGTILKNIGKSDINLYYGVNMTNHSAYRVFYSDLTASRNRCNIYYNWDVLLALFGGILGLFIGFSFVSAFELIYYFTIRPFVAFMLQLKREARKINQSKVIGVSNVIPKDKF